VQSGCAARERDRVIDAHEGGEFGLEGLDVRAEGRDPVGVERVEQQLAFGGADVGW